MSASHEPEWWEELVHQANLRAIFETFADLRALQAAAGPEPAPLDETVPEPAAETGPLPVVDPVNRLDPPHEELKRRREAADKEFWKPYDLRHFRLGRGLAELIDDVRWMLHRLKRRPRTTLLLCGGRGSRRREHRPRRPPQRRPPVRPSAPVPMSFSSRWISTTRTFAAIVDKMNAAIQAQDKERPASTILVDCAKAVARGQGSRPQQPDAELAAAAPCAAGRGGHLRFAADELPRGDSGRSIVMEPMAPYRDRTIDVQAMIDRIARHTAG